MKTPFPFLLLLFFSLLAHSQSQEEWRSGKVSFRNNRHVYVRFSDTRGISQGDTLWIVSGKNEKSPVCKVISLSSTSCVCQPFGPFPEIETPLSVRIRPFSKQQDQSLNAESSISMKDSATTTNPISPLKEEKAGKGWFSKAKGRFSVSSASQLSDEENPWNRMRYHLLLTLPESGTKGLRFDSYLSYSHNNKDWTDIQADPLSGLRIYQLSLAYSFHEQYQIWAGRRIHPELVNLGAIDGLLFQRSGEFFQFGFLVGSRPSAKNYGFDAALLQYGGFAGYFLKIGTITGQSSLALIQQTNKGNIDRRIAYVQQNFKWKKLFYLLGSAEFDLYRKSKTEIDSPSPLTTINVLGRIQPTKSSSIDLNYSGYNPIIFYYSYRDFVTELLEKEGTRGYSVSGRYRFARKFQTWVRAGLRTSQGEPSLSRHFQANASYSGIGTWQSEVRASFTRMESVWLSGEIWSLGFSGNPGKGKVHAGCDFRAMEYRGSIEGSPGFQYLASFFADWRFHPMYSLSLNTESSLDDFQRFHRLYFQITRKF